MPDLDMFMRWASREMKMFCCWREAATLTASGAGEGEGWDDGLSFAKQIKHFPANRGLWSGSRSRPQSWNNKDRYDWSVCWRRTFANVGEILQLVDLGVVLQQVQGEEALVADPAGQAGLSAWSWNDYNFLCKVCVERKARMTIFHWWLLWRFNFEGEWNDDTDTVISWYYPG